MKTFFDPAYLEQYISERSKSLLGSIDLGAKITETFTKDGFDAMLTEKLTGEKVWRAMNHSASCSFRLFPFGAEISAKPEGMMLQTMAPMFGGISGYSTEISSALHCAEKSLVWHPVLCNVCNSITALLFYCCFHNSIVVLLLFS